MKEASLFHPRARAVLRNSTRGVLHARDRSYTAPRTNRCPFEKRISGIELLISSRSPIAAHLWKVQNVPCERAG